MTRAKEIKILQDDMFHKLDGRVKESDRGYSFAYLGDDIGYRKRKLADLFEIMAELKRYERELDAINSI